MRPMKVAKNALENNEDGGASATYIYGWILVVPIVVSIPVLPVFADGKADKTFNMFKLLLLIAVTLVAVMCAPAPVPPLVATHPLVYPQSYVKVIPIHPGAVPLTYHHGYKWVHPGSVYLY
ncbi:hypothetical protein KM043_006961 [Ampulex compressa]|nr:hypothetical protein KM043_006961 [Ampulex compressa]